MINVAVVGLGHWGPNLARHIAALPSTCLHTLCDIQSERLESVGQQYPSAKRQRDFDSLLKDSEIDAVIIATPVQTHFPLASAALRAGKHVLVEKPLAQTSAQCQKLIALSEQYDLTLMVGHVFLYSTAVHKVKEYIDSGELGKIYYIYSQRLNLGIARQNVNSLWNSAPHDLSILCYWLDAMPKQVSARGYSYIQPSIEDIVFMTLDFPDNIAAHIHTSWLDPRKVRCITVVGSRKMLVYDDMSFDAKIAIYDKGITKELDNVFSVRRYNTFEEFHLLIRPGDVLIPDLHLVEPLKAECQHFVDCIQENKQPLTDGYNGLQVVRILEAAQQSLTYNQSIGI